MTRLLVGLILLVTLEACSLSPTAAEGTCVPVAHVDGVGYTTASERGPAGADVDPDVYLEITRSTGCLDQGQPFVPLGNGESNFLPAGTTLHRIAGFEPRQRLAFWARAIQEWSALVALP